MKSEAFKYTAIFHIFIWINVMTVLEIEVMVDSFVSVLNTAQLYLSK